MSDTSAIRCRPHPGYWFIALTAIGFGLLILLAPSRGADGLPARLLGALFLSAGLALLCWILSARVIADADGLSWRTGFRLRSVPWSGVADYYEALPPRNARQHRTVVETSAGTMTLWKDAWTNLPALREAISQRSTSARAKSWGTLGARPEDSAPKAFTYDARHLRAGTRMFTLVPALLVAFLLWRTVPNSVRLAHEMGWGIVLGADALWLLLLGSYVAVPAVYATRFREGLRRADERVIVDAEGITFEAGTTCVASPWPDIVSICRRDAGGWVKVPALLAIETRHGSFVVASSITDFALLRAILKCRAPQASLASLGDERSSRQRASRRSGL